MVHEVYHCLSISIVVDLFAGLGGASIGIERGLVRGGHDRPIDVAVNYREPVRAVEVSA